MASVLGTRNTCTFCRRGMELLQHPVCGRMLTGTPGHPALPLPLAAVGAAEATPELSCGAVPCEQGLRSKLLACSLVPGLSVRTIPASTGCFSWGIAAGAHGCLNVFIFVRTGSVVVSSVRTYVIEMCKTMQCQQPCQALKKPEN